MHKGKFAAATALSSCTLLSFYGYSHNEMLGTQQVVAATFSLDYKVDNSLSSFIVQQSQVKNLLQSYKPSWFYANALVGNAASLYLVPEKEMPEHETLKVRSRSGQGGYVCYDIMRASEDTKKVIFIVPGVNSSLQDHHVNTTARKAVQQGFHAVVVNPVRPDPKKGIKDLELIDYSKTEAITESVETIKALFGADSEIYAVGFSLGSNHLLRHLGAHENCKEICGIRAAVSISGAYEVRASACTLRTRVFGVYDWYMRTELQKTFTNNHFRVMQGDTDMHERVKSAKTLSEFDTLVRAPIFGYKGASRLFRNISCDAFVLKIETPLLALSTKDDSITDFKFMPVEDLKRNPNVILATLESGGHCDLFFQTEKEDGSPGDHQELSPLVALEFFNSAHDYFALTAE